MSSTIIPDASTIRTLAEDAGRAIAAIHKSGDWTITNKSDQTPFTQADTASNEILTNGLARLSSYPIISEENPVQASIVNAPNYWLVDPLDGTRDFINGFDSFAICIALIENSKPVFGLIHSPLRGETWWAIHGQGTFNRDGQKIAHPMTKRPWVAAASRSHPSERMNALLKKWNVHDVTRLGSAIKFGLIAEGAADLYIRFGPTHEWDTAAGQIILEEAGCELIEFRTGKPMVYGKPDFLNRGFLAARPDIISQVKDEITAFGKLTSP